MNYSLFGGFVSFDNIEIIENQIEIDNTNLIVETSTPKVEIPTNNYVIEVNEITVETVVEPTEIVEVGNVSITYNSDVTFPIPQSEVIDLESDLDDKVEIQVHTQVSSSTVWTVTRPTTSLPLSVRTVNSAGDEIIGDVTHSGVYTYITFTQSINGTAYIGVINA